jgi:hypothetical protein
VWQWDDFTRLTAKKDRLVKIIRESDGSHSLLQLFQEMDEKQAKATKKRKDGKAVWGPWMWQAEYQLVRMIERAKKSPALQSELQSLQEDFHRTTPPYADLHDWAKAARWAQLVLRKKKRQDDENESKQRPAIRSQDPEP